MNASQIVDGDECNSLFFCFKSYTVTIENKIGNIYFIDVRERDFTCWQSFLLLPSSCVLPLAL
jgi:hypothetical protein